MTNAYRLLIVVIFGAALFWVAQPEAQHYDQTKIKLFCTNGRVFIQFEEKHNTWGTMWLDNQGKPVKCNDDSLIEEKISTNII